MPKIKVKKTKKQIFYADTKTKAILNEKKRKTREKELEAALKYCLPVCHMIVVPIQ